MNSGASLQEEGKKDGRGKPEPFDFLGFTPICPKKGNGKFALRRKTMAKRFGTKLMEVRAQLRSDMDQPVMEMGKGSSRCSRGTLTAMASLETGMLRTPSGPNLQKAWLHVLRRRSQKGRSPIRGKFKGYFSTWFPTMCTVHPYPDQRLRV